MLSFVVFDEDCAMVKLKTSARITALIHSSEPNSIEMSPLAPHFENHRSNEQVSTGWSFFRCLELRNRRAVRRGCQSA